MCVYIYMYIFKICRFTWCWIVTVIRFDSGFTRNLRDNGKWSYELFFFRRSAAGWNGRFGERWRLQSKAKYKFTSRLTDGLALFISRITVSQETLTNITTRIQWCCCVFLLLVSQCSLCVWTFFAGCWFSLQSTCHWGGEWAGKFHPHGVFPSNPGTSCAFCSAHLAGPGGGG